MAATRALVAAGARGLRLLAVPTSGLQADVLVGAGCADEVEAAAIVLGEAGVGPRFAEAVVVRRDPGARHDVPGRPRRRCRPPRRASRSCRCAGSSARTSSRARPDWRLERNPFADARRPDRAAAGDPDPTSRSSTRRARTARATSSSAASASSRRWPHAARSTLVTVEEVVDDDLLGDEAWPPARCRRSTSTAIAVAPGGARPLGCQDLYDADDDALAAYAEAARTAAGFAAWLEAFLAEPAPALP